MVYAPSTSRRAVFAGMLAFLTGGGVAAADVTGSAGSFAPVDNSQPSLVLPMFIQHEGVFGIGVAVRIFAYPPEVVSQLTVPLGQWMPCDGRALSRVSSNSLFQQIGTTYGAPDANTFRVPDLRGRAVMGEGTGDYLFPLPFTRGQFAGLDTYVLNGLNLPAHDHQLGQGVRRTDPAGVMFPAQIDTMQPSIAMNYTIQTSGGIFPPRNDSGVGGAAVGPGQPYLAQVQILAATPLAEYGATPCDGRVINIATNTAVFALCGWSYGGNGTTTFAMPDLRGRLPMGAGGAGGDLGTEQGERLVSLSTANLPPHTHSAAGYLPPVTGQSGGGQAFSNLQPSLSMTYCIAVTGVYPSGHMDDQVGYVGEILLFAGNFAPAGYVPCDGRELSIADNDVLYLLIGNTFGAASPGNFRVPDLRGRTPVAPSPSLPIGLAFGGAQTSLTAAQMPQHSHAYSNCVADVGAQGGVAGHDGLYDNNDFVAFIELFFVHDARADLGIQGGLAGHDSAWDNNDFVAFIDAFFTECH